MKGIPGGVQNSLRIYMPGPHPRSAAVLQWFSRRRDLAQELDVEAYRVAGPRHTTAKEIVSGTGAYLAGGRWNPVGDMKVVYLSDTPETATKEALEHFRYHGLPISSALPKVIIAVRVRIERSLDLTDPAIAVDLPISIPELLAEDWRAMMARNVEPASQAVGWAAFAAGFQGVRVPSRPDPMGTNLLVFPELLVKGSRLEVLNADELDKLGRNR
jgi:RES domain-containing protein